MKTSHAVSLPDSQEISKIHTDVLTWYNYNQRALPWRAVDAERSNPYYVWLSEIMLQQTTVTAVIPYFIKFLEYWPTIFDLAKASEEEVADAWAGLGYYSRARNLHKCAQIVANEHSGQFPNGHKDLLALPGIGPYTAGAICSIAFNQPTVTVDGNIDRVFARYFNIETPFPHAKPQINELASTLMDTKLNLIPSFFVQALMDIGATICQPKKVQCNLCPLKDGCKSRMQGNQLDLPKKEKKARQSRVAVCYVVEKGGEVLLERRPDNVLFGRMLGLPTSSLYKSLKLKDVKGIKGYKKNLFVEHVFTHFSLKLYVVKIDYGSFMNLHQGDIIGDIIWSDCDRIEEMNFPSLFRKVLNCL